MASPYSDADPPAPLYLANDDEWEAQMDEQQRDQLQVDEQADEEDVAQSDPADLVQPIRLHLSDVPDSAYWDDSALTSCFTAALADYKVRPLLFPAVVSSQLTHARLQQFQHPALFGPPREAPRSQAQKHSFAPL